MHKNFYIKLKKNKVSILHKACWKNNVELVKQLLSDSTVDANVLTNGEVKIKKIQLFRKHKIYFLNKR